jgi:hypothetical protein
MIHIVLYVVTKYRMKGRVTSAQVCLNEASLIQCGVGTGARGGLGAEAIYKGTTSESERNFKPSFLTWNYFFNLIGPTLIIH